MVKKSAYGVDFVILGLEKGMEKGKILARYEDGMAPEEIAYKMGLTVKQVEAVLEEFK